MFLFNCACSSCLACMYVYFTEQFLYSCMSTEVHVVNVVDLLTVREDLRELSKDFDKSEDDLKSLQSGVGQIVGEVLRQLTEDKCECVVCACV